MSNLSNANIAGIRIHQVLGTSRKPQGNAPGASFRPPTCDCQRSQNATTVATMTGLRSNNCWPIVWLRWQSGSWAPGWRRKILREPYPVSAVQPPFAITNANPIAGTAGKEFEKVSERADSALGFEFHISILCSDRNRDRRQRQWRPWQGYWHRHINQYLPRGIFKGNCPALCHFVALSIGSLAWKWSKLNCLARKDSQHTYIMYTSD